MLTGSAGLIVRNDLSELTRVRVWIDDWARLHQLSDRTVERLHVCSTEAVTNVIMHAFADRDAHQIALTLEKRGGAVVLEMQDDGDAFDPLQRPLPERPADLASAQIGGLGILMMRRFSDEMHYRRVDARNVLTLVLRPSAGEPARIDSPRS
jgi:serine/threonine-protein kinase RsbW